MRIAAVEISGFRAFGGSALFDLKGDIVLGVGANGQGKLHSLMQCIGPSLARSPDLDILAQ